MAAKLRPSPVISRRTASPRSTSNVERSELRLCPQEHSQDRLDALGGALEFWPFAGDEVEVDVGLDDAHDDVSKLVQIDGEIESRGIGLLYEPVLQRIDKPMLEVRLGAGQQAHGVLAFFAHPAPQARLGDDCVKEADHDRDDPL